MKTAGSFRNPPAEFHPGYFWFLNDKLTEEKITRELEDMAAHGAKTVCPHPIPKEFRENIHSRMSPDYLSAEYFKKYQWIISECERLGMVSWLYDEGGWPSGTACGKVCRENPGKFSYEYLKLDENGEPAVVYGGAPYRLAPGETEEFIRLTHESYRPWIQRHFGKNVRWTFTDEPILAWCEPGVLPWVPDLEKIFSERKGYDVRPYLKAILEGREDGRILEAKVDYFDVLSRLFKERYFDKIGNWCHQNGLLSGGHLNGEDEYGKAILYGHGSLLRNLRAMDIPGVDLIWRQIFMDGKIRTFPKLASSVAAQKGTRLVMAELFGVYGNGLTPEQMRYLSSYMLVMGVNLLVYGVYPYSTNGPAKGGERPHFGPVNPVWKYIKPYHQEMARLCFLNTSGTPCADTALFFPTRSFWSCERESSLMAEKVEKTAVSLLGQQTDFDFVDDDVLEVAEINDGKIVIGSMQYKYLVIPEGSRMTAETQKKLEKLRQAGIPVLSEKEIDTLPPMLRITPSSTAFLVRHIHTDDGAEIYFVLNTSGNRLVRRISFPETAPVIRCNAETGKFLRTNGCEFVFEPFEMLVFAQNLPKNLVEDCPETAERNIAFDLKNLQIKPLYQIRADKPYGDYEKSVYPEDTPAIPVQLSDWANVFGPEFSGEAVYSAEIEIMADEMPSVLDLGRVCYIAQAALNGKDLGTRLFPPYAFDVRSAWKPGVNKLEIRVANTLANAVVPDHVQEVWKKDGSADQELYNVKSLPFERESLPSGLFGPVLLKK